VPFTKELSRALEHRRALLRARRLEIERAIQLRAAAAQTVLASKDVVLRSEALLDDIYRQRKLARASSPPRAAAPVLAKQNQARIKA